MHNSNNITAISLDIIQRNRKHHIHHAHHILSSSMIYNVERNKISVKNIHAQKTINAKCNTAQISSSLNKLYFACKYITHKCTSKNTIIIKIIHNINDIIFL